MDPSDNCIKPRDYILVQREDYMKLFKLKASENVIQLSQFRIQLDAVLGCHYHDCFRMQPKNGKLFALERVEASEMVKDESGGAAATSSAACHAAAESGSDNRDIRDDGRSQTLSKEDIERLRDQSCNGQEILTQLISNSQTFALKTEYSQQKYVRKKRKKYYDYITIRRPTVRLLAGVQYRKTGTLRIDDLSQILTAADLQASGRFLLYDSGSNGLLPAAILNALGADTEGLLIYAHPGNESQRTCVDAMAFPEEQTGRLVNVNIYSLLRWYYQTYRSETATDCKRPKSDAQEANVKCWQRNNERACEVLDGGLDALIIASKEHPLSLVEALYGFVKRSRALVVHHALREPLQELYVHLTARADCINVHVSSNFMRHYQVLPERTHPLVNMDSGGYLLTALKVMQ